MKSDDNNRLKILYIAGWGRSGTTILGNIIGQAPGFQFVGEIQYIWHRGLIENQECGCGEQFNSCKLWEGVIKEVMESFPPSEISNIAELSYSQARTLRFPWLIASVLTDRKTTQLKYYLKVLEKLYMAVQHKTGCNVIIDSSKSPMYAVILGLIPNCDVHFLHLVRDARAVAYSYITRKRSSNSSKSSYLSIHPPYFTAFMWTIWNFIAEFLGMFRVIKYYRMRYEDFTLDPQIYINQILTFMEETPGLIRVKPDGTVHVAPEHSISGNPSRFEVGEVKIRFDNRWIMSLDKKNKMLVSLIAWPFLLKYRYIWNL